MDWYPLYNSLRIAAIACVAVFFTGIFAAYYVAKLPRLVKGLLDVVLTLPMVLPPTVVGYFLLLLFGVKRPFGIFLARFGIKVPMTWWSAVFAAAVVSFPLMYRTACGAFEALTRTWPTLAGRWASPIPTFSGGCGCPSAARAFWPVRCSPLPARWGSTVPPA